MTAIRGLSATAVASFDAKSSPFVLLVLAIRKPKFRDGSSTHCCTLDTPTEFRVNDDDPVAAATIAPSAGGSRSPAPWAPALCQLLPGDACCQVTPASDQARPSA